MTRPARRTFCVVVLLILATTLGAGAAPAALPSLPRKLPPTGNCYVDNVFYGTVPPGGQRSRVLVFVHGLSGLAEDWWSDNTSSGLNDMYYQAYKAGYRTAFVNLNVGKETGANCAVERRPANDMLVDGRVFSKQIDAIIRYYGVRKVDVVAHSKGGIDAQAAGVWWNTWLHIDNFFTIGTPHQGSLLCDLLWSPDGFWLSVLLGQRDDATYSMQTAVMQQFRSITDASTVDDAVHYYSGAGNFWRTPGTIYEVSGKWLQDQPDGGDNDGVVTVASTSLAGATRLFLQPWNHAEITIGHNSFSYIDKVLHGQLPNAETVYLPLVASAATPGRPLASGGRAAAAFRTIESRSIVRGGRLGGPVDERIPIEPEARAATFGLLASDSAVTATLIGPDGARRALAPLPNVGRDFFAGAFQSEYTASQPRAGQWDVQIAGPPGAGYLLLVTLDSSLQVVLDGWPEQAIGPGQVLRLGARSGAPGAASKVNQVRLRSTRSDRVGASAPEETLQVANGASLNYTVSHTGLTGLSITVRGETTGGMPFERSFVRSVAALPADQRDQTAAALVTLSTMLRR